MELVPTAEEVMALLRETGALRFGHFVWRNGLHTGQYLETALAMRYYRHNKTLSIGLSRLLRANAECRAILPELSIVSATPAGVPIAYGLCEALRARQVYWAEREHPGEPLRFRQYLEQKPGEKVLLVNDVLRTGLMIEEARRLLIAHGAEVVALAVLVTQPNPATLDFSPLPLYTLATLNEGYYASESDCDLCRRGVPVEKIGADLRLPRAAAARV